MFLSTQGQVEESPFYRLILEFNGVPMENVYEHVSLQSGALGFVVRES